MYNLTSHTAIEYYSMSNVFAKKKTKKKNRFHEIFFYESKILVFSPTTVFHLLRPTPIKVMNAIRKNWDNLWKIHLEQK